MPEQQSVELDGSVGKAHVFSAVSAQRGDVLAIDLKPALISLELPSSAFKPDFRRSGSSKIFDAAVGGGSYRPGVVWIFMGEDYVEYDLRNDTVSELKLTHQNWAKGQWPSYYRTGFDTAVTFTSQPQYMWFFKGDKYFRYDLLKDEMAGGPHPTFGNWPGWPESFASGLDAAIEGRGACENMAWFFKGQEFIRYNDSEGVKGVDIGPTPIADKWRGWPAEFTKVDCAISGVGGETELIYFFCGDRFITYDLAADEVITSPRPIGSKWPKLSSFVRQPQLFLVESMKLRTYYGEVSAGPPQGESYSLAPKETQQFTVIITKKETQTASEKYTVLESQDIALVDNLNETMREESASGESSQKYDYGFDSSFHGDLSYTLGSGDVNASLNFKGGSNDVRKNASEAAGKAVQKQIGRTEENKRQSTRVVSGTHASESTSESTFFKSVHNPSEKPITIGVFQLYQQYLAFVTLNDVKIAFANGGRPDITPLSRLDVMLEKYTADADTSAAIKKAVLAELAQVLDHERKATDVLTKLPDGRVEFNGAMNSTFAAVRADGTSHQDFVMPGLILSNHSFRQLTEAAIVREITVGV